MKFEDFISRFPVKVKTGKGWNVLCPSHADKSPSLSITENAKGDIVLHCHAKCTPEEICGSLGIELKDLFADEPKKKFKVPARCLKELSKEAKERPKVVKKYSYQDAFGKEVYQSCRTEPKNFRQRHWIAGARKWVWNMDGVERVLYHLPEVLKAASVWIVEGEKDADNLTALGFTATCNVGGAKKWLDSYNEVLAGKDIVLCGDNDEPGEEHVEMVFDSVAAVAKSVRKVSVPLPSKDISDFLALRVGTEKEAVNELLADAVPHYGGIKMPIYTMGELEPMYKRQLELADQFQLDLGNWLPSLRSKLRPLIPGDVMLLMGDTGAGKTALLQNIAEHCGKLKTLMFELELPPELIYERQVSLKMRKTGREVENEYRSVGNPGFGVEILGKMFPNVYICPEPRLSLKRFEELILRSELKIGCRPNLVLLDYIQLLEGRSKGEGRYEKTSAAAEEIKIIAKATKTIIVIASQVQRRGKDDTKGINLFSGKDSGSLENSSGLVIGAWRDAEDDTLMHLKVFKATRGGTGAEVLCNFDGAKTLITERARQPNPEE